MNPLTPPEETNVGNSRGDHSVDASSRAKPLRQVIVRMPPEMHDAVKDHAARNDLQMSQVIRAAVRAFLGLDIE